MKPHYEVVGALIFDKGKLFATKKGDSRYEYVAHKYEFPGGKIETGETREDALKRELQEELSLSVKVGNLYASNSFEYPDFTLTLWVYDCEALSGYSLKEHESAAWISPSELCDKEWAPADREIIRSIKRIFGE